MVLTDKNIKTLAETESLIEPFAYSNLQPASYDLTISKIETENEKEVWIVNPGETVLIETAERVKIPSDVCAFLKDKSSYLRAYCTIGQGFIDPGFDGVLTVSFTNHSDRAVAFEPLAPFCQIVFVETDGVVSKEYDGHYQGADGLQRPQPNVLGIGH